MSERPTPLTDKEAIQTHGTPLAHYVRADFARRLELDRAALMEALGDMVSDHQKLSCATLQFARRALAAANANFPTP